MRKKPQAGTKIFGLQIGVDPKILVGGLIVFSALLYWFNSRGDDAPSGSSSGSRVETVQAPVAPLSVRNKNARRNRAAATADRGVLRIRPVDATHGNIDPTLRLELLARLQSVDEAKPGRSLFEIGPSPQEVAAAKAAALPPVPQAPIIPVIAPGPPPVALPPQANIPLKFYGFVRPAEKGQNNRGLFLEGDNIQVASEGELIDHRYLVRELTAVNARLEDTQIKQGQTLQVVPEAKPQ